MDKKKFAKEVKELRTVHVKNYLGLSRLSASQFAAILTGVARRLTNIDITIKVYSISDWEDGDNLPNPIAMKAIEYLLEKTKGAKPPKNPVGPRFKSFDQNKANDFVERVMR